MQTERKKKKTIKSIGKKRKLSYKKQNKILKKKINH